MTGLGLTIAATVLAAVVATLALGLCKAAGRARPTPPPLHQEADHLLREHER